MHIMGTGKQMKYEELLSQVEDIMDRNAPSVPQMCLTPIENILSLECEILIHLLRAQLEMQMWRFLPSLMLNLAHTRLAAWESKLQNREYWKLGFGATFLKTSQLPALLQWLLKLKSAFLAKFSLYFYTTLAAQTSPQEMKTFCSKLQNNDYIHKIQNFHRRYDATAVIIVFDARGIDDYKGPGYHHPNKLPESPGDLECYPITVSYPMKPLNHMPNVVKIITERASDLAAMDKVVYHFSPRVGGYILPFVVMGLFLMIDAVFIYWLLPRHQNKDEQPEHEGSLIAMLRILDILLDGFCIVSAAVSMGFLTATLEPHIRMFELTPMLTGLVFVISGSMYAVSAPIIGRMCDRRMHPKKVIVFGSLCIMLSYFLVGPMPGVPLPKTLYMCILGLMIHGLGSAAILVPSFSDILNSAYDKGFGNDFSTFGMVSGIWAAAFSLGAFIGPSVAGLLYDQVGFQIATLFPVGVQVFVFVMTVAFICCTRIRAAIPDPAPQIEDTHRLNGHTVIRNLPQDITSLTSKCNDNIRQTGYGSFGSPSPFLTVLHVH